MTDYEIASIVNKYKDFLKPSNGGITVSGGEALMQPKFVKAVFERVHKLGLTTCLDTACYGAQKVWDEVLPHTDYVMLCLKGMDNEIASKVARVPTTTMARSKEFARYVRDQYPNIRLSLRWVLMSGLTDSEEELGRLVSFAQELSPVFTHVELIPYHELGRDKYTSLNMSYALDDMEPFKREDAIKVQEKLERLGVKATMSML